MATTLDVFGDVAPACRSLSRKHPALRKAVKAIGAPHIRRRPAGFQALFRIIVEQQVSVPSAQSILKRLETGVDMCDPAAICATGPEGLRALGLSTPKARYVVGLAENVRAGAVCFDTVARLDDDAAAEELQAIRGVGPWTAAIYLLFCEGRSNIWPARDVALKAAFNEAAGADLSQTELDELAQNWGPHKGVAAHILWTYYAHILGRTPI
jgi:DNA-3-methyladenine glycosylase II